MFRKSKFGIGNNINEYKPVYPFGLQFYYSNFLSLQMQNKYQNQNSNQEQNNLQENNLQQNNLQQNNSTLVKFFNNDML